MHPLHPTHLFSRLSKDALSLLASALRPQSAYLSHIRLQQCPFQSWTFTVYVKVSGLRHVTKLQSDTTEIHVRRWCKAAIVTIRSQLIFKGEPKATLVKYVQLKLRWALHLWHEPRCYGDHNNLSTLSWSVVSASVERQNVKQDIDANNSYFLMMLFSGNWFPRTIAIDLLDDLSWRHMIWETMSYIHMWFEEASSAIGSAWNQNFGNCCFTAFPIDAHTKISTWAWRSNSRYTHIKLIRVIFMQWKCVETRGKRFKIA